MPLVGSADSAHPTRELPRTTRGDLVMHCRWPLFLLAREERSLPRCYPSRRSTARLMLEYLEGRNLPSFLAPLNYSTGRAPSEAVADDFDHDGLLDVVTVNYAADASLLRGNGGPKPRFPG